MPNRTIAIGDIHGCADALNALLDVIQPDSTDTLVTLGDYVDRGPRSAEVLEIMTGLLTVCLVVPILGNHEVMLGNALSSRREFEFWLFNGGSSTVQSYGGDMRNMPQHHRTFLKYCKRYHETDTHIFLHAAYDPDLSLDQQPDELLLWQHIDEHFMPGPHCSGKTIVCGHTPQTSGEIRDLGHIRILDTFCYGDKWLTAMDMDTGEYIQARNNGVLREGRNRFSRNGKSPVPPARSAARVADNPAIESLAAADARGWPFTEERPSPLELRGDEFRELASRIVDRLADYLDNLERYPVLHDQPHDWSVARILDEISEPLPEQAGDTDLILDDLVNRYAQTGFNTTSHGYLAYIPGGGLPDAALADLIAAITNRYVGVWRAAPALARIESTVVRWFCTMTGLGPAAGGFLTTGGSQATFSAFVAARQKMMGEDFRLGRIYTSSQAHYCIAKAAFMAGFPRSSCRQVPVDAEFRMDPEALQRAIDADRAAGFQPMLVAASAGTTGTGAVDDLERVHRICQAENLWMNVDAAYGGFFVLTHAGGRVLRGIERADSVVLDPHKGMFLPYGTGCLLVADRNDLAAAFRFQSSYLPEMTDDPNDADICEVSPELSRANRSLRIWFPFKRHGAGVFRRLLQEKLDLTTWACERIEALGRELAVEFPGASLEMVARPQLTIFAFRLRRERLARDETDELNRQWLEAINRRGSAMMSSVMLPDGLALRICVLSFRTHIDRMELALGDVGAAARALLQRT